MSTPCQKVPVAEHGAHVVTEALEQALARSVALDEQLVADPPTQPTGDRFERAVRARENERPA